jgi:hypothetical protein
LSVAGRPGSGQTAGIQLPDSVLVEVVFVNAFDHVCLLILHADIVANHQRAESSAVDQDDSGGHPVRVRNGLRRESARGDKDAPIRLGTRDTAKS